MSVITISRGTASGGQLLAEGIAKRLGYEVVSREDIVHETAKYGVSEKKLQEAILKPLSLWDRLGYERTRYLAFIQEALCEKACKDNIVYHGNAGHLLLRDVSHVFCLRLIAPASYRAKAEMEKEHIDFDEAMLRIDALDRQRRDWTQFLYGVDYMDPELYDLVVNLKQLTLEGVEAMVTAAVQREEFATTAQSRKEMGDLLLASRVRAALAANEETASAIVEVRCDDGAVSLKGKPRSDALVEAILKVAGGVQGVKTLNRQELDSPEFLV